MSDAFSFESDSVQRVPGVGAAVIGLVAWASWAAAHTLLAAALGLPSIAGLVLFVGPSLWFVAARRWLRPPPSHGSVEWSGAELAVLSGSTQVTVARDHVAGGALFPDGLPSVRLSLADGSELRLGVPDLPTGERLLAALGCDAASRPYTFVGDVALHAMGRAHLASYAGLAAGFLLSTLVVNLASTYQGAVLASRAIISLACLAAVVAGYRASLRAPLRVGVDGVRSAARWFPLDAIASMRTAEGTLVLVLTHPTAVYLNGTAAAEDEATAAAVTRRLWTLQQGDRTDAEVAAALAASVARGGASRADGAVYRQQRLGVEALTTALRDGLLPMPLRLDAAAQLAALDSASASLVRRVAEACADDANRRALEAVAGGRSGPVASAEARA